MMPKTISAEGIASSPGRAPLVLQVADWLVQQIVVGRFAPGEWLREQDIADEVGASRGPVREALRLVELEGLVEMIPWRGARVMDFDLPAIDDLFEVASALTGLVSRLAATHADEADFDRVEGLIAAMRQTIVDGEPMRHQLALSFETSAVLRQICGSPQAASMLMKIGRVAYWQHRHLLDANITWRRSAVVAWENILKALRARDGAKAEKLTRLAVAQSKDHVMQRLRRNPRLAKQPLPGALDSLPPRLMRAVGSAEGGDRNSVNSAF